MNRLFAVAFILLATVVAYDAVAQASPVRRRSRPAKPSGGLVFSKATGKRICILNAQNIVPPGKLREAALKVTLNLHAPIDVVNAKGSDKMEEQAAELQKDPGVGAWVAFIEDDRAEPIAFYPDTGRCYVNVKALTRDSADKDLVNERAAKQLWRSLGYVLGAGDAIGGYTVLQRATSLERLDAITAKDPSPEQHNRMVDSLDKLGIKMLKIGTYRTACQQGWAPAPTNDVQKAIWDEVHAMPTAPLKIKPETKKVAE